MRKLGAWLSPNGSQPTQNTPPPEEPAPPAGAAQKPADPNGTPQQQQAWRDSALPRARKRQESAGTTNAPAPSAEDCLNKDGTLDHGAYQNRAKAHGLAMRDILNELKEQTQKNVGLNDVAPERAIQVLEHLIGKDVSAEEPARPKA
jgi:hypothetical protein